MTPRLPSHRQADVLDVIVRTYRFTGEPVSGPYLSRKLNMPRATLRVHLAELHRKGWLRTANAPAAPAPDYLSR